VEWAAPDVSAPAAPRPPAAAPWRAPDPAVAPTMPRLAPMTASDVLDGAFAVLKRSPGKILGFTAVFTVPVQMVSGWLQRDLLGGEGLVEMLDTDSSLTTLDSTSGSETWAQILLLFGPSLALVFVAAGLARLVGAWHVGADLSFGQLMAGSRRHAWPLLASWTLVHLAEGVGLLLCGLPALAAMTWFLVVAPVIGAEDLGPIDAMRRSARLTGRRFWPVLGLALLSALVATLFGYALGLLPTVLGLVVGTDGLGWVVLGVAGVVTGLVTMPVVAAATVLIYLDLRVRTEGLDLELDAARALPAG
jgi:hypothetical protein